MKHSWRRAVLAIAAVAVLTLAAAGCGDDDGGGGSSASGPKISLSSQDFGEQKTLAQVYGQYLKSRGFNVDIQKPIGARTQIYKTIEAGKLDMVIDYAGSAASELDPEGKAGKPSPSPDATAARLKAAIKQSGAPMVPAKIAEAQDANALVANKTWAEENNITKISDLAAIQDEVVFGGSPECVTRADCLPGYKSLYGITFKDVKSLAYGPPLVEGLKSDDVQVIQYQTTGPEIADGTFVVLEDDKGLLSADPVVPLIRDAVADEKLIDALNSLSAELKTEDLAAWNKSTDVDKEEPADVATAWLQDKGLD